MKGGIFLYPEILEQSQGDLTQIQVHLRESLEASAEARAENNGMVQGLKRFKRLGRDKRYPLSHTVGS